MSQTARGAAARRVLVPASLHSLLPRPQAGSVQTLAGQSMGTSWSVKLAGVAPASLAGWQTLIEAELAEVVAQMSHWAPDSALGRFNRAAAGSWQLLPPALRVVLEAGLRIARASDGAFDPAVGALVNLWGFGPPGPRQGLPAEAELALARAHSGWQQLRHEGEQWLQPGGLQLDLSGIAKGYAVDAVSERLQAAGVPAALVEVGGELRGFGVKPDAQPWWVAIAAPPGAALPEQIVALHGLAMASSGDYLRHFEHAGRRYAHTLDPRSGRPLVQAPASVTVLHPSCMLADAHATAITVLGAEAGMAYARQHDLAAYLLERRPGALREHWSPAYATLLG